jgi:hypothetical protein
MGWGGAQRNTDSSASPLNDKWGGLSTCFTEELIVTPKLQAYDETNDGVLFDVV